MVVERPAFAKLLNDRQRDSIAFAQRHHIAVVNALDGNVMLVHVIGDLLDVEVKIAGERGDELPDGHLLVDVGEAVDVVVVRMAVVGDVDVIHADGLAGGLNSVVHLLAAGGGVNHHDLILKAQNGAVGGDDAGKDDFQQRRTFFKAVILRGILHKVDDDGLLLSARAERKEQQDKRTNTQQTVLHGSIPSFVTHKTILTSILHDSRGKCKGISGCLFANRELRKNVHVGRNVVLYAN